VLVIFSKIYFLYKNLLTGIFVFKILLFPILLSVNNFTTKYSKHKLITQIQYVGIKSKNIKSFNLTLLQKEYAYESDIEKVMKGYGLIDIHKIDTCIIVKLQYATEHNFLGKNIYHDLLHAYLQNEAAEKLKKAEIILKYTKPNYRLIILDAARPLSLQKVMWDEVKVPIAEKDKFVANPVYGSLHNYGAAVDATIADSSGKWLDMGTSYDSFENLAYPALENGFLKSGKLSHQQVDNRLLLRTIMKQSGFSGIETEWWHFNSCSRDYARKNYSLVVSHIFADNPVLVSNEKNLASNKIISEPNVSNINFRVQIMTSSQPLKGNEIIFKDVKVERYFHNGLYKYTSGKFKTLEDAFQQLSILQKKGFSDAFIVAFNNNTRIGIKDASELLN
jgi:zinc D-Ala-D-Ala dipeptidase